ncbi:hypothetical protein OFN51_43525, partial [Escherichia coli]|nr:hypothetical protein [Escherichia coli]
VCCFELSRFLAWDGLGAFDKSPINPARGGAPVHVVHAPAFLICGHPRFALPIAPHVPEGGTPKPWLVELLEKAADF